MEKEVQLTLPFTEGEDWAFLNKVCGDILPWNEPHLVPHGEESPKCLLEKGHDGPHLICKSNGEFVLWDTEFRDSTFDDDVEENIELHWDDERSAGAARLLARSPVFAQKSLTDYS